MDRAQEREHLAQADRHIAELKEHITRQRDIVKRVLDIGHPSELAETTLRLFEDSERKRENPRKLILDQWKRRSPGKGGPPTPPAPPLSRTTGRDLSQRRQPQNGRLTILPRNAPTVSQSVRRAII